MKRPQLWQAAIVGLIGLFVGLCCTACFRPFDTGRIRIGPDGEEIVTNAKDALHQPKDGDPNFMGPPRSAMTLGERKAKADADFDRTVEKTLGAVMWALVIVTFGLVIFAALSRGASWHGPIVTGGAWVATLFLKHWLAQWGILISNLSLLVVVIAIGYTLIHNYRLRGKVIAGEAAPSPTIFSLWNRIKARLPGASGAEAASAAANAATTAASAAADAANASASAANSAVSP